jgi:transcriptional regulator with XRE-family HTH domain
MGQSTPKSALDAEYRRKVGEYLSGLGLNQEALGDAMGVSRSAANRYVNGTTRTPLHNLTALRRSGYDVPGELEDLYYRSKPGAEPRRTPAKSTNHLRAWREYRRLTAEELAQLIGTRASVIQALEADAGALSSKWLRRLAPALRTEPGFLQDIDPSVASTSTLQRLEEFAQRPTAPSPSAAPAQRHARIRSA